MSVIWRKEKWIRVGVIHIWRPLWERRMVKQKWDVSGCRGWGVASVLEVQSLAFSIKENWICVMTRHHTESNINTLLTRNLPIDSGGKQWSHHLMIPLHCLLGKSTIRTRGQFACDVSWFYFCFDFVCLHARCGCWRGLGEEFV